MIWESRVRMWKLTVRTRNWLLKTIWLQNNLGECPSSLSSHFKLLELSWKNPFWLLRSSLRILTLNYSHYSLSLTCLGLIVLGRYLQTICQTMIGVKGFVLRWLLSLNIFRILNPFLYSKSFFLWLWKIKLLIIKPEWNC